MAAHNRSSQIDSTEFIINISYHLHHQDLHCFIVKNRRVCPNRRIAGRVANTKEIQSDTS
jgi:hypothetical protein